jgi:biotin transport system substrate-specific component
MPRIASSTVLAPAGAPPSALAQASAAFESLQRSFAGRVALGLAATLVVALAAHVDIPLPFTPVPFILTPLAVLGAGLAFGPFGGFAVLSAYLLEGACGLPVFGPHGPGGVLQLLGPTGGFLMAYPIVAMIAGFATRISPRIPRFAAATAMGLLAITVLFASGAAWLYRLDVLATHASISLRAVAMASVWPFLPGDLVKVLAAAGTYSALTKRP